MPYIYLLCNQKIFIMAAKETGIHILVIEDEPKVAQFIKNGLDESGFIADIAADGYRKNKSFVGQIPSHSFGYKPAAYQRISAM